MDDFAPWSFLPGQQFRSNLAISSDRNRGTRGKQGRRLAGFLTQAPQIPSSLTRRASAPACCPHHPSLDPFRRRRSTRSAATSHLAVSYMCSPIFSVDLSFSPYQYMFPPLYLSSFNLISHVELGSKSSRNLISWRFLWRVCWLHDNKRFSSL